MGNLNASELIVPVIMAGGSGTRLWPISRETMPKQFIEILAKGRSTFQNTLERVSGPEFAPPVIVTGDAFRFITAEQAQAVGIKGTIVLEPARRDSAPAVAVGATIAALHNPDAVCLVMAADHYIPDGEAFVDDCLKAARAARDGLIMTLGIKPDHPSTAYGYIDPGAALQEDGAFRLKAFVEKPDRERAQAYLERGLLWNSGNFLFPAKTMIQELEAYAPQVLAAARESVKKAKRDLDFLRLDVAAFETAPRISIDYAVMEKTANAGVVRAGFNWSDIGSWDSIHDIKTADENGNVLEGDVAVLDTKDSLVLSQGPLTTVVGLEDVIVVSTLDAVLVTSKDHAGRVKDMVGKLAQEGREEATQHLRIHRPWGWYQRIDIGPRFQVKHICVHPGGTLSLQKHHHRAEHWVVIHGTAEVTIDGDVRQYHENEAVYLPIGCVHRMHNPGKIDLKIIEVQVGSYTGEDDIVRIEDVYARK